MTVSRLVIGSRGSDLALWQAHHVQGLLRALQPGLDCPIEIIKTEGDHLSEQTSSAAGWAAADGKGFFTKELEEALLARRIDLAVHSLKDLPTVSPAGLSVAAIPEREDPHDVWLGKLGPREIAPGAKIGTSSLRRKAQLRAFRPDLEYEDLRGNVPTRVRKLNEGRYDAIVLARAGLFRLGLLPEGAHALDFALVLPAPGQGALGIQTRDEDSPVRHLAARLEDRSARLAVTAERALLQRLEGGCLVPVGAHAELRSGRLTLDGMVASLDGTRVLREADAVELSALDSGGQGGDAALEAARALGEKLGETLIARGADRILAEIERR